jgi:uncharacterized protein
MTSPIATQTDHRRPTALITGASAGIGRELASMCAGGGHDVVLVARNAEALEELAAELTQRHGVRATVIASDLTDPDAPTRIAQRVAELGITVDVLINNAGYGFHGAFAELDAAREMGEIQVNVAALTHLSKLFLPGMLARHRGRILNVASTAAFVPGPFMAVYHATKAYVYSLSLALSVELERSGVTVTVLCPGPTRTKFADAAGTADTKLFRANVMSVGPVARMGYDAMMRGDAVVVPGLMNKVIRGASRLAPHSLNAAITRRLYERA